MIYVLQNMNQKVIAVTGASIYRFLLCLSCFYSRIIWWERKLAFDFILISSLLLLCLFKINVFYTQKRFPWSSVGIWDKQFLVYQSPTSSARWFPSTFLYSYFWLKIFICTVYIQYFYKKSKDLLIISFV